MNISYKWLKEYVDFDLSAQQVAEALTSIGLEVDAIDEVQTIKGGLQGLVVGQVLTCEPHPNSDHMHVCTVDEGTGEPVQIVCGAPNVAAGQKVIVATLGCKLYDGDNCFVIKRSKLRGVESLGMICAEDEIGIGTDHAGIIVLPDSAQVGMPAATYYGIESDWLIEVDITPNRADACSHYGVARDLYAWLIRNGYSTSLHRPSVDGFMPDNEDLPVEILVENKEACPRYCAVSVTDCEVKESPKWLQDKLRTIGCRPINNIVDITNYILFAYGQPLHCFDADMITGHQIHVRTYSEGTPFVTLDGEERKLSDRDLCICNDEEPMCIAGVFGGKGSGTYETTRNVLFESAYFHPTWIRKSARRHGLSTDASFRFERGVDPNGQIYALKAAALMARELAGGKISMQISDSRPIPVENFKVDLKYSYVDQLIGKALPHNLIKSIVKSLEMTILEDREDGICVGVPPYRVDVQRPCDVVEDILRIYGYNNVEIPTSLKSTLSIQGPADRSNRLQNLVSEQLVGEGFNEILNNSLTKSAYYEGLQTFAPEHLVRVMNPLSQDLNVMRQTLLFGALESIAHNLNRKVEGLRFFEFGNTYRFDADRCNEEDTLAAYSERLHLGLWITGKRVSGSWAHPDEKSSVYELKAYLLNIFSRLGLSPAVLNFEKGNNDVYACSESILSRNGKIIAEYGTVLTKLLQQFEISGEVYYADINWTYLMNLTGKKPVEFRELTKFPPVSRDLALLLDANTEFADVERVAYQTERKLLQKVELFDVYQGKNLEEGKKSYAVNFILQDASKTLNDKQIDKVMTNLIQAFEQKLKAKIR